MKVFYELLNDYRDCLIRGDHMDAGAAYIALMSENDAMQSRLESLEKENRYLNDGCAELEAQIKSLEKDAARYRWLKADGEDVDVVRYRSDLFNFELGDELDAAIDTAMQANKGE